MACCFGFLHFCGLGPKKGVACSQAKAQKQAEEGLADLVSGYQLVAELELPPGAARVLASLRRNIAELEPLLQAAEVLKARPWLQPLDDEHEEWELLHPEGGTLLRRQIAMASDGGEEWFVGGLFISDKGIVFDVGDALGQAYFFTGFVDWEDITSLQRGNAELGPAKELTLTLKPKASRPFSKLLLQLSILRDLEWLEEFWRMASSNAPASSPAVTPVEAPAPSPTRLLVPAVPVVEPAPQIGATPAPQTPMAPRTQMRRSFTMDSQTEPSDASLTGGGGTAGFVRTRLASMSKDMFVPTSAGFNPAQIPEGPPACSGEVKGVTFSALKEALSGTDWIIPKYIEKVNRAHDIVDNRWANSKLVPGTKVRKVVFTMPLPKELPRAVAMLVKIPEESKVTNAYRLRSEASQAVLSVQTCTHDVTLGESFRIQETMAFYPESGGVGIKKWVEVVWVAPLPWTHGPIKAFVEKKAHEESVASLPGLVGAVKAYVKAAAG